ncbi:MAG: formate/nitrite transporter family protein [Fusobacteriaceae bacterium]
MLRDVVEKVGCIGVVKKDYLKSSVIRYFLMSSLAGIYVGLGILLIFTVGGIASPVVGAFGVRILMGVSFGVALSLVVMAGSELFTGNNLVMTIASLQKKVSWAETLYLWVVCYLGNLFGSFLVSYLYYLTGLTKHFAPGAGDVLKFFEVVGGVKAGPSFTELFFRGVLCNLLVCLAVWCSLKMTSESGKLIMIWWCLFTFITVGLEHSIANMTIYGTLIFHDPSFIGPMFKNLIPVTLGNTVGGMALGAVYYFSSNKKLS